MKALVYHGPGQKAWEEVQDAAIQEPTDVVVRVDTTTICGTDLHILQGDVAAVTEGRILGHEAVGTITEAGEAVKSSDVCGGGSALLWERSQGSGLSQTAVRAVVIEVVGVFSQHGHGVAL